MNDRDQILKNLSTLKDKAKVYHQAKQLRACGLQVEGSDEKFHEHSVAQLRQLLQEAPAVSQEPTAASDEQPATDFAEPDTFASDVESDVENDVQA